MTNHPLEIIEADEYNPVYYSKGIHKPFNFLWSLASFVGDNEWAWALSEDKVGYGLMRYNPAPEEEFDYYLESVDNSGPGVFPITVYGDDNGRGYANMDRAKCLAFHFGEGSAS